MRTSVIVVIAAFAKRGRAGHVAEHHGDGLADLHGPKSSQAPGTDYVGLESDWDRVAVCKAIWQYSHMAKQKTTLSIDEDLMRQVRIRAARSKRTQSEVLETALREGLGVIERMRAKARLSEDEALQLASEVVHEVRGGRRQQRKR